MYTLRQKASVDDEIKTRRQMAKAMHLGMGGYCLLNKMVGMACKCVTQKETANIMLESDENTMAMLHKCFTQKVTTNTMLESEENTSRGAVDEMVR